MGNLAAGIVAPSTAFPWPTLPVSIARLESVTSALIERKVQYHLGAKADSLAVPPTKISTIDCSGFVRYALFQSSGVRIPDGSVQQHDWIEEQGFKRSTVDAGVEKDCALRIAFLSPSAGGGVGHVVLISGGRTLESHGGVGPDRRDWNPTKYPWMGKTSVYVLTAPKPAGVAQ